MRLVTDCPNRDEGFDFWKATFLNFDRNWDHSFDVKHQNDYEENFSFTHKEILFIGLNIPGGRLESFWTDQLAAQLDWTTNLVQNYVAKLSPRIGRIVLFAHALPKDDHKRLFFAPLATFIEQELNNETPFLFIHGDGHLWISNPGFMQQSSFLEIMVSGGTRELPLKLTVHADGRTALVTDAFQYQRNY